jgi:hypothetical protein
VEVLTGGGEEVEPPVPPLEVDGAGANPIGAPVSAGPVTITRRSTFFTITTGRLAGRVAASVEDAGLGDTPKTPTPVMKVAPPATQATARTRPFERRARRE